jgi:hypothetical protein
MRDGTDENRPVSRWALPASLVVHLLGGVLLIFGLPVWHRQPEKEKTIKVDLVKPPKPTEKARKEPPPAKQPEPKKVETVKVQKPPEAAKNTPPRVPIPVLRPVVQFGDKDAGPRKSPEGRSAREGSRSVSVPRKTDELGVAGEKAAPKLKEAKTLFSQTTDADPVATTAMRTIPRDSRIGRLCATELRDQLLNATPPYLPELLPFFRLKAGTVMNVPQSAFQAGGEWYDLSFRCEVDRNATKVVSFAFRIGDRIPRGKWKERDLPPP